MSMKSSIVYPIAFSAALVFGTVCGSYHAMAQTVSLDAQTNEIHTNMPFQLAVIVKDFDESPEPVVEHFEIENADVAFVGVTPSVSKMVTNFNGRMTVKKDVTFYYNYQVTPRQEGLFTIPVIKVQQGSKSADTGRAYSFKATNVPTTSDMRLELVLPTQQKIWVGQTFDASLDWLLRKNVSSQSFDLPILKMTDYFEVEEPNNDNGRSRPIAIQVGSRQIGFPFTRDSVMVNGMEYTRFRINMRLTALKAGVIEIPPSQVTAALESGMAQDMWGFGRPNYTNYRAEDIRRSIVIQELPKTNRPSTFSNAMGEDFNIQVTADRTILKSGDPIILTIDISSPSSMDGLILPSLVDAGLNEQLFGVSNQDPIGENIEGAQNRNIRRFTVPVRIKSERVTEIPPLAFSYFNPKTEQYSTVRSQPIALSVTAVEKIGISNVVSGQKEQIAAQGETSKQENQQVAEPTAGALELGLVSDTSDFGLHLSHYNTRFLRIAIYILPFLVWGLIGIIRRARRKRDQNAPQREAILALKKALKDAANVPAREASSSISNALNSFLSITDTPRKPFQELTERMDAEAYRPNSENRNLPEDLIEDIRKAVSENINPMFAKLLSSIFALLLVCSFSIQLTDSAQAQENVQNPQTQEHSLANDVRHVGMALDDDAILKEAQKYYYKAMESTDRNEKLSLFKRAAAQFGILSEKYPNVPNFLVDEGNAYLAAVDLGHASLAYHRALALDPSLRTARSNLSYIQSVVGEDTDSDNLSLRSAFFLNDMITRDGRLLLAAIFFAIGVLLLIPWNKKTRRITSFLSIIPFVAWLWMLAGAYVQPKSNDVIVMTEYYLKTADNAGASNVSQMPVEPGVGLNVINQRGNWLQVETTNTSKVQKGWISASAVEFIER